MSDDKLGFCLWSNVEGDPPYETDPIAAMQRMIDEAKKPSSSRSGPMYLLPHSEFLKAARGEPFVWNGILCVLVDGHPVPKALKEEWEK